MADKKCFVCTEEIRGKRTSLRNPGKENSSILCQILELPHFGNDVQKSSEIRYCPGCTNRISSIANMLDELEKLEKKVLDEKYKIEVQMKENSTNLNSKFPSEGLRTKIVTELKTNSIHSMLEKIRNKRVGQKSRIRVMKNVKISALVTENTNSEQNINYTTLQGTSRSVFMEQMDLIPRVPGSAIQKNFNTVTSNPDIGVRDHISTDAPLTPLNTDMTQSSWVSDFEEECGIDLNAIKHEPIHLLPGDTLQERRFDFAENNSLIGPIAASTSQLITPDNFLRTTVAEHFGKPLNIKGYKVKTFTCGICKQDFNNQDQLTIHRRSHLRKARMPPPVRTKKVQKKPTKPTRPKNRVPSQKVPKVLPCRRPKKCEECGKMLADSRGWRRHIILVHHRKPKHKCSLCDFRCPYKKLLANHMKTHHSTGSIVICHLCDKLFTYKKSLENHIEEVHTDTSTGQTGAHLKKENKVKVKRVFKKARPSTHVGRKVFTRKTSLEKHHQTRTHTERTGLHLDETVSKKATPSALEVPPSGKSNKTLTKPRRPIFSGKIPNNVVPSRQPKKCDECGKLLSSHRNWKYHVRTHHLTPKHKCTVCDFGSRRRSLLIAHMKKNHSGQNLKIMSNE